MHLSIIRNHFPSLVEHTIFELALGMMSSLKQENVSKSLCWNTNKQDTTSRVGVSTMLGKRFTKSFHYKVVEVMIRDIDKPSEKVELMSKADDAN